MTAPRRRASENPESQARWARVWAGDWPRLPALFERKIAVLSARGGR
ncbi:hypothetical protein HNP52_000316 [Sphingomonas kyeonggiensis]|uniref:Uncharacterized protein n=1 Tax=Sphingomonas kyeonggiensis TaxID=1268553 RepID=A0A7W7JYU5_9SPHN|nr:hypothetical protein [Sphingomonas kyeonggiensis]MBB4837265.1 hypothetical protein [Sphingomonas kyeonggiensis]